MLQQIDKITKKGIINSKVLLQIAGTKIVLRKWFSILNNESKLIIIDFDKNESKLSENS